MIIFSLVEKAESIKGKLAYSPDDYAFNFETDVSAGYDFLKRAGLGSAPLVIDYLQVETSVQTGFLLYVHGLRGHHVWRHSALPQVRPTPGIVRATFDREMKPAVGVNLVPEGTWTTVYDPSSGWVYVGPPGIPAADQYVEFATDTVAALAGGNLVSLWLRPQMKAPIDLAPGGRSVVA